MSRSLPEKVNVRWAGWGVVAVAGLILVLVISRTRPPLNPDDYITHYETRLTQAEPELEPAFRDLLETYFVRDYETTLFLGQNLIDQGADRSLSPENQGELRLMLGVAALQTNDLQRAIHYLLPNGDQTQGLQKGDFAWYLALAYWKNGQLNQARQQLVLVTEETGTTRQEQAQNLLEVLD